MAGEFDDEFESFNDRIESMEQMITILRNNNHTEGEMYVPPVSDPIMDPIMDPIICDPILMEFIQSSDIESEEVRVCAPMNEANMIRCLGSIFDINLKIVKSLRALHLENASLKSKVKELESACEGNRGGLWNAKELPREAAGGGAASDMSKMASIDFLNNKFDNLEQATLRNVILCQGSSVDAILVREKNYANYRVKLDKIKAGVVAVLNTLSEEIFPDDIFVAISVRGNKQQHLKLYCSSRTTKEDVLRVVKQAKPRHLFISDYLTKYRFNLFYKLRVLRKQHSSVVSSIYTRNGSILCRTTGASKPVFIASEKDYLQFEDKVKHSN